MIKNIFKPSSMEVSSGIVKYIRDRPPAHCLFKIDHYSKLLKANMDKYETGIFEAEGHKWRLIFYPNGDKSRNIQGYISLYVKIEDPSHIFRGHPQVKAQIKFFVADHQKRKKYLTICREDCKEAGFTFKEDSRVCGFPKFLSIKTFKEESKYLHKDSCEFGAEVFVVKTAKTLSESLTFVEKPDNGTFVWTLAKFSELYKESYRSDEFPVGGRKWNIKVWPKGKGNSKGKSLSVFLISDAARSTLPTDGRIYAEFKLRIKDHKGRIRFDGTEKKWFTASEHTGGFHDALSLEKVREILKRSAKADTLIFEAQILLMSVVSAS